jgi:DNA-binding MarR family transcriptional regulator
VSHGAGGEALIPLGAGVAVASSEVFPTLVARDVAVSEERRLAAFEEGLGRLSEAVGRAAGRERSWLSRVRAGVVAFLAFFDDEPGWGRVLVREAPVAPEVLALHCRARLSGVLGALLDDGAPQALGELTREPQLTGELIAGGVVSVVRGCVLEGGEDGACPLVELAPELMAFIVGPYLGQAAARMELEGRSGPFEEERGAGGRRLYVTRRTRLVLRVIADSPRSSNREVAQAAGLVDEGQTSKLLRRLAERGLIENVGLGQRGGRCNAWLLTARGERLLARFDEQAKGSRAA